VRALRLCTVLLAISPLLPAQDLKEFEKKVTEFTLANGFHFIVVERHDAPVVSFHTYVNAGAVDDPSGETGIAHMFEHMAFKGTETIGTRDWPNEKKALDAIEEAYDKLEAERNKGPRADESRVSFLETQVKMAIDRAQVYVLPNEYTRLIEENGGAGLNAGTSLDSTEYYYSLPSNRIELWFLLESQRFLRPVFREFYKERDVVLEEYRQRVESSPRGKLLTEFLAAAFDAHPYHNPPGGWPSDITSLRRADAQEFFDRYYVPANIDMAIVGDVNAVDAKRLAERYFGVIPARPLPPLLHTREPLQPGPRRTIVLSPSQPLLVIGYKRPDQYDKSDPVFDVMQLILSSGRTGWMYKDMVQDKKIALAAQAIATYPSGRYMNLFAFYTAPAVGHTVEENEKAIDEIITRLKTQKVDTETLDRAKTQVRAQVIRSLADNAGLANYLTTYYANYGDWRKLFTTIDDLGKVTGDDVQRVARQTFIDRTRTVAFTVQPPPQPQPRPAPGATRK
jgi:predicted Zn-dependent peptidase